MKLINSCLTVLVFINAVYSAAMREGSEDLLRFLKDAFEMSQPLDHADPTQLSELNLATEKILDPVHPTDPTTECKAPEMVVNSADFSNTTPEPNLVEPADVAEERSRESSNADSRLAEKASAEDSREGDSDKRLQLRTALSDIHKTLQEHYATSESMSMDRTDMDTDMTKGSNKDINKATVIEDISSQEMDILEENGGYRPPRTQNMLEKHNSVVTDTSGQNLDFMKEMNPIIQSFASRMNLKDQAGKPHDTDKHQQESRKRAMHLDSPEFADTPDRPDLDADSEERGGGGRGTSQTQIAGIKTKLIYAANQDTLDNNRELAEQILGCTETSVEHPMEENNSLDAPNVDQKIQKDTMNYQNQLRNICPTKRVRAFNNPRAQLG
ncbi:hypothetical protein QQF64_010232 [Cirrhinus molitorella]|uniref:Uncharacterized protein n=1 Tax=Cirrhinus molitorella TaxID=172907 RepID=A0ABR3M3F5_9TELE